MLNFIKNNIVHIIYIAVILAIIILVYYFLWNKTKTIIQPEIKTLTKVIPVIKSKIKYRTVTVTKIQYIPQTEYQTITKTELPAWAKNKNIKILATGKVPAYQGQTLVTSTLDIKTGKGSLAYQQLPFTVSKHKRPFFQLPNRFFIQGGYGYMTDKSGTVSSGIIGAGYKFLRVGNINFKVKDDVYLNSRNTVNFVGLTAQYNF